VRLPGGHAGLRVLPPPRPPGDQDRRRHADLRRPAPGDRRLVPVFCLVPGPLGQQLRTPHLTRAGLDPRSLPPAAPWPPGLRPPPALRAPLTAWTPPFTII